MFIWRVQPRSTMPAIRAPEHHVQAEPGWRSMSSSEQQHRTVQRRVDLAGRILARRLMTAAQPAGYLVDPSGTEAQARGPAPRPAATDGQRGEMIIAG